MLRSAAGLNADVKMKTMNGGMYHGFSGDGAAGGVDAAGAAQRKDLYGRAIG